MTQSRNISVTCPECQNEQPFMIYSSINAKLNEGLTEKILSRELFAFSCEQCQTTNPVHYPLLYHDMKRSYMIWLKDSDVVEEMQDPMFQKLFNRPDSTYRFRLVRDLNELIEKIRILDEGLDDRLVEINKFMIMFQLVEQQVDVATSRLYFSGLTDADETMLFVLVQQGQPEPSIIQFSLEAYSDVERRLEPYLKAHEGNSDFIRVDWEYAHDIMTQYSSVFG